MEQIINIEITVVYEDEEGETQVMKRESKSFESASEDLGKLERSLESKNV